MGWELAIQRGDIRNAELVEQVSAPLAEGEAEFAIERFALTSNNVTYALFGNPSGLFDNGLGYWDFFSPEGGTGRLPVWGFASVVESRVDGLEPGQCFYGYWPMASNARLRPEKIGPNGFADFSGSRATMPAVYNQYVAVPANLRAGERDLRALFRPLHLTGWLLADELADVGPAADLVLVSGASSKTAIGFAHAYRAFADRSRLVGLTSARGRPFAERTGLYDDLVDYAELGSLDPANSAILVDIAGNGAVAAELHDRFGDKLLRQVIVGKSHWDSVADPVRRGASGFFAPARIAKRLGDWGPAGLRDRADSETQRFLGDVAPLYRIDHRQGAAAALDAYREAIDGRTDPQTGVIVLPA